VSRTPVSGVAVPPAPGPSDVRRLLAGLGVRPSKGLGQHFVADPNTVRRIVRLAGVAAASHVVEIGAGLGSLTVELARTGAHVVAVELDHRLAAALRDVLGSCTNVRVVEGDGLHLDLGMLLLDPGPWQLVANLPYNVATPIVLRVLEEVPAVASMLVMVQREVAERLAAPPGSRAYGAVSVKVRFWGRPALLGTVPASVFVPKPKVESALVRIERHDASGVGDGTVPYRRLVAVVNAAFGQRRKMLRRSLAGMVEEEAILEAGVAPTARAEELDVAQFAALAARASVAEPTS